MFVHELWYLFMFQSHPRQLKQMFITDSKVLFIFRRASPGTRAGPLCRNLTFTKNSIALLIMFYLLFIWEPASPVRRDPAFAYPRSRQTGLVFLHISSAARAGIRADIVHKINFKRGLVHSLNFEAGWRRKRSRRDKQMIASLQGYFIHH